MKKMIVTIIILFIIFVSMVIYKDIEKKSEVTIDEINKIEEYMKKIYGWKEVTNEALPEFDNINNVDEKWIWGTVRENIDDYEIDYNKIEETIKELYGKELKKQYPKEGNEFISYDNETRKYQIKEINLDAMKDSYLLNTIEKNNDGYTIEIIEYLIDYTDSENGKIFIKNLNDENIYELKEDQVVESNLKKLIKQDISKFSKKKITLEKEEEKLVIRKVEKEN